MLEARTGDEALVKVAQDVDLVILDIMMPGLSGTEVPRESCGNRTPLTRSWW